MLECYLGASNHQPFDYWRAHHVYNVASQPRTSDRLACHWRALCLLAYDNWRYSIQPEIFHSLKVPSPSRDSISDRQRESPVRCNIITKQSCRDRKRKRFTGALGNEANVKKIQTESGAVIAASYKKNMYPYQCHNMHHNVIISSDSTYNSICFAS